MGLERVEGRQAGSSRGAAKERKVAKKQKDDQHTDSRFTLFLLFLCGSAPFAYLRENLPSFVLV